MKKQTFYFLAGAMILVSACTSTDTATDDSTVSTTETTTTDATGTDATTGTTGTDASGTAGTAGTEPNVSIGDLARLDDPTFVTAAASSNMFEIEAGNLAMQNASDQKVKDFGSMMVEHHTMANQELQTLASQMGATMPQTMVGIHREMLENLAGKTGKEFDEDYMDAMETAHKMDIAMFEAKANNATDSNLKAYAVKTLPILETHRKSATDLEDTVD